VKLPAARARIRKYSGHRKSSIKAARGKADRASMLEAGQ
jgi:hypothetical protein